MTVSFPPHITNLESVVFHRDGAELERRIGRRTRVNVRQEGAVFELGMGGGGLQDRMIAAGVDLDSVMDLELWTPPLFFSRDGMPATVLEGICAEGAGRTVFLCLNGPSFDAKTRALLANRPGMVTFGVNNGGHDFRPNLWTCVDAPERFMESIWTDATMMKFVPLEYLRKDSVRKGSGVGNQDSGKGALRDASEDAAGPAPRILTPESRPLISPNSWGFHRNEAFNAAEFLTEDSFNWGNHKDKGGGRSVMLVALKIAYLLGFRRVVLVGCDFEMTAEKRYWFAEGRTDQAIRNNETTYEILRGFFAELVPVFAEAGFAVVNATPGSKLDVFPRVDLSAEVDRALVDVTGSTEGMYQ